MENVSSILFVLSSSIILICEWSRSTCINMNKPEKHVSFSKIS